MEATVVAPVYNGYGRFVPDFLWAIHEMEVKPENVIIVLGENHGYEESTELATFIFSKNKNIGALLNEGIHFADTEWIIPMDIDDTILPDSIIKWETHDSDYICSGWKLAHNKEILYRESPLPQEIAKMTAKERSKRRINNNSPFRRWLWEKERFQHNNFPNLRFLANAVEQGAKFSKEKTPCFDYRQHGNSLCRSESWKLDKPSIRKEAKNMYEVFEKHYL